MLPLKIIFFAAPIRDRLWETTLLEQAKILMINVPNDRAEHRLHKDMLSVHIPSSIPELCALETRSRKMLYREKRLSKIAQLGKIR